MQILKRVWLNNLTILYCFYGIHLNGHPIVPLLFEASDVFSQFRTRRHRNLVIFLLKILCFGVLVGSLDFSKRIYLLGQIFIFLLYCLQSQITQNAIGSMYVLHCICYYLIAWLFEHFEIQSLLSWFSTVFYTKEGIQWHFIVLQLQNFHKS